MASFLIRIFGSSAIGYLFIAGASLASVGGIALWWHNHNKSMINRGKLEATLAIRKATDDAKAAGVRRKAAIEIRDTRDGAKAAIEQARLKEEAERRRAALRKDGETGGLIEWLNTLGGSQ